MPRAMSICAPRPTPTSFQDMALRLSLKRKSINTNATRPIAPRIIPANVIPSLGATSPEVSALSIAETIRDACTNGLFSFTIANSRPNMTTVSVLSVRPWNDMPNVLFSTVSVTATTFLCRVHFPLDDIAPSKSEKRYVLSGFKSMYSFVKLFSSSTAIQWPDIS